MVNKWASSYLKSTGHRFILQHGVKEHSDGGSVSGERKDISLSLCKNPPSCTVWKESAASKQPQRVSTIIKDSKCTKGSIKEGRVLLWMKSDTESLVILVWNK